MSLWILRLRSCSRENNISHLLLFCALSCGSLVCANIRRDVRVTLSRTVAFSDWLRDICDRQPEAARLLGAPEEEQHRRGYFHTLHEIFQQPSSWIHTAEQMSLLASDLRSCVSGIRNLVLTGSGSSEYAGDCVRLALQKQLS